MRPDHPYPPAPRLDLVEELHGHPIADPYRWLEDADDPRTESWSAAQDALYQAERAEWPERERFAARLTTLHAVGGLGVPAWRGDRSFLVRRDPGQDHGVLRTAAPGDAERALVDPTAIDPTGNTTLDFYYPSPDGRLLAYGLSEGGTEAAVLRVMDVATGHVVDGPIDRVRYTPIAWLPDSSAFYYVRHLAADAVGDDDPNLHRRVHRHRLGDDPESDPVIFGADAPRATYFDVTLSHDGRWLAVCSERGTDPRNDVWLADLSAGGDFAPVQQGVDAITGIRFGRDGQAYLLTNRDAPRWRLCVADPQQLASGYSSWRTLAPEDTTAVLNDYALVDDDTLAQPLVVVLRTRHAISELAVHDVKTGAPVHDIALPGVGTVTALTSRRDGGHEAWFSYTDFTTPTQIMRYDATTAAVDVWATPAGDASTAVKVVTRQVTYPSYDGTEVRMFIASAAPEGSAGDGGARPARAILYGYGGFNISRPPAYDPYILAWIEAGGVFALASLRGGSEEGESWHRAGMRESKQNVFDDFAAAADWLVAEGLTTHAQLGIFGGSNGGLLVGAALTQHPDKYGAVVCSAPLLDMIRYERFGIGSSWNGEYGTVDDAEEFEWLRSYSPYHHVRDGVAYPAVVFTVFEGDSRVDPLHARKMCAALQHATSSGKPVLIRREKDVGHAGRAVSRTVELAADRLAFFTAALPA